MMKTVITLAIAGLLAASVHAADSKNDVKSAAKKLADKPNYSWVSTPKTEGGGGGGGGGNFRAGPTEGKIEKGGWTQTTASFGDNKVETFIKGEKFATKREDEWKTGEELEGDDRGAFLVRAVKAFKAPASQAEDIADKVKELKKGEDGSYSGELTEEGATALLSRGGRGGGGGNAPTGGKGTAKFWIKDGALTKFEYNVQGSIKVRDSDEERKINRTTTVEIKDIGTTKIDVPAEVKKKLS